MHVGVLKGFVWQAILEVKEADITPHEHDVAASSPITKIRSYTTYVRKVAVDVEALKHVSVVSERTIQT